MKKELQTVLRKAHANGLPELPVDDGDIREVFKGLLQDGPFMSACNHYVHKTQAARSSALLDALALCPDPAYYIFREAAIKIEREQMDDKMAETTIEKYLPAMDEHRPVSMLSTEATLGETTREAGHVTSPDPSVPFGSVVPGTAPSTLLKFKLGDKLGSGAFGQVFMCITDNLQLSNGKAMVAKQVPIKRPQAKEMYEEVERIRQEIDIFKDLQHSGIVQYFGSQREGDIFYIFMEHMPKGSLRYLIEKGSLSENLTRRFTRQVLEGLIYLHDQHVAHRDIKGDNILLDNDSNAKLCDFGLSARIQTLSSGLKTYCGTSYFMAPEVVKANEETHYGRKADIWSLGCTVVEMLTGNPPWYPMSVNAAIFKIGNGIDPVYTLPENVSQSVRDFLKLCFTQDPKLRPSAVELRNHRFIEDISETVSSGYSSMLVGNQAEKMKKHGEGDKFLILSVQNDMAVTVKADSAGAAVVMWERINGGDRERQLWHFDANGFILSSLNNMTFTNLAVGEALTMQPGFVNGRRSQWRQEGNKIRSGDNELLTMYSGSARVNGAEVASCNDMNTPNQRWHIVHV